MDAAIDDGVPSLRCFNVATHTTCDPIGGIVCETHRCRCSRPLRPKTDEMEQTKAARRPGSVWRVLSNGPTGRVVDVHDAGIFDELVVSPWLHLEQMNTRQWWMAIETPKGAVHLWFLIDKDGKAIINVSEGAECLGGIGGNDG
jgi:hypothetical protein